MFAGEQLKAIRQKEKMSQEELGHQIGVNKMTISNWEQGKIALIRNTWQN